MSERSSSVDSRLDRKYPADCYYGIGVNRLSVGQNDNPLAKMLEDIPHLGCFACKHSQFWTLPELHVSKAGIIPTPLSEEVQGKLQQLCEQQGKLVDGEPKQIWQLDASLLAITDPDWDRVVLKFAEMASEGLGIVGVAHIEAWLQHITLHSKTGAYQFVSASQAPQDHFATMVVLLVPTNTAVEATVKHGDKNETLQHAAASSTCVGYMACEKDCSIHFPDNAASYGSMVYHLVQPAHIPLVIKDRAWMLNQPKMIMDSDAEHVSGSYRCFYLFRSKYDSTHLEDVQQLDQDYQCMASMLQEAEQQGMLDVYLAKITHHSQHEVMHRLAWQRGRADTETTQETFSETSVSDWRKLDGSNPGWGQQPLSFQSSTSEDSHDFLMQHEDWLRGLEADKEVSDRPGNQVRRWQQYDPSPAYFTELERWKYRIGFVIWPRQKRWLNLCLHGSDVTCAALHYLSTTYKSLKDTAANGSQQADKLKACKTDIAGLVEAMYDHFYGKWDCCKVPGYDSFGDAADALGLPEINQDIHKHRLQGMDLTQASAQDLINTSGVVPWPDLCVILASMIHESCVLSDWHYLLDAFEGLNLLLDVQEPLVHQKLLDVAIQVATVTRQRVANAPAYMFREGITPRKYTPGSKTGKDGLTAARLFQQDPIRGRGLLVVESVKLLQALQLQACKHRHFSKGLEKATCVLVDSYTTHPKLFKATTVLGPACLDIAEAQPNAQTVFGSPAGLKLLIGGIQQLQQLAQPEAFCGGQDRGSVRSSGQTASTCSEDEAEDQVASMQQVKMMLPQLQDLFDQAVVTLFMQSGKPPPENHTEAKRAQPRTCCQHGLYDVWKPVKREKIAQQ